MATELLRHRQIRLVKQCIRQRILDNLLRKDCMKIILIILAAMLAVVGLAYLADKLLKS
jgi:hypothetical protein